MISSVLDKIGIREKENMTSLLMLAMSDYLARVQQPIESIEDTKLIHVQYRRLCAIGLESSANAIELKKRIDRVEKIKEDARIANELITFVKNVHSDISNKSILVSNEQFNNIRKKYSLSLAPLSHYSGVVPERNIQDIENAKKKIYCFYNREYLNHTKNGYVLYAEEVVGNDNDEIEALKQYVYSHDRILIVRNKNVNSDGSHRQSDIIDENLKVKFDFLSGVKGQIIKPDDMLIACPGEYIKGKIKVTKKSVDPIVFQFTPFGILVHTVWGEEAEDAVLKQYMELNLKIDQF